MNYEDNLCEDTRKVYYRGIFGPREIKVLDKELVTNIDMYGYTYKYYRYLIRFKTGRLKIVDRRKLF